MGNETSFEGAEVRGGRPALAGVPAGKKALRTAQRYYHLLDVTLAWKEGPPLQIHKVILAAYSQLPFSNSSWVALAFEDERQDLQVW